MKKIIVMLAAIAMVGAFTATAALADADIYGSARFRTYYTSSDSGKPGAETQNNTEWQLGYLSRFGVNFKSDKITGKMEFDARVATSTYDDSAPSVGTGASGVGDMRIRQLWGQYDFGTFKFMIGQNFPLYDAPVSNIAYFSGGLQAQGGMGYYIARTSQMRFTFGNFRLALLAPDTSKGVPGSVAGSGYTADYNAVHTTFPKVEVRYDLKIENFALNFDGGYQTYEVENYNESLPAPYGTRNTENINSYVLGFRGKANFGPGYVGVGLTYRQNGNNYGAWTAVSKESPIFQGNDLKDATAWGTVVALGWKINDMVTIEGNYAYLSSSVDTALDNEDDNTVWAALAQIHVAPGFLIQPEFIYNDRQNVTNDGVTSDQGNETIFGVWWLINFK
jgi:hypothetical protein